MLKNVSWFYLYFQIFHNFLQCPSRWTGLQLVISPGPNPLPAVVRLKYSVSPDQPGNKEFYGMNIVEKFDDEQMRRHVYKDPVQLSLRIIMCRSLVIVFTKFNYEKDTNTKDYAARFPIHHEQMLPTCIDIVNDEFNNFFSEMLMRADNLQKTGAVDSHRALHSELNMLRSVKKTITTGVLAKLFLKCTDTFRAKKNWNSHGGSVGASICQLASILSQMQNASINDLDENFNVIIPQGNEQGGAKHGNHHVVYSEYMCSVVEEKVLGNVEAYLSIDTFRQEKHGDLVKQLFSETVPGYPDAPAPRPTRAHTYDFNCTYQGARLLDGECKASASTAEIAFMVLHSQEQLVTQDMAMTMLTTSHQMAFYKTIKMKDSGRLKTTVCRTNTYELGHVKDKNKDSYSDEEHIQKPPTCRFKAKGQVSGVPIIIDERDGRMIEAWKSLRSEPRLFIRAVMDSIDILTEHFGSLDLYDVRRRRNISFNKGWKEPEYRTTTVRDLQTKREIIDPERFLYCPANMNPEWTPEFEEKFNDGMIEQYTKALNEPGLTEPSRVAFQQALNIHLHKRRKTSN